MVQTRVGWKKTKCPLTIIARPAACRLDITRDLQSMKQPEKIKRHGVRTGKGKAAAVSQDAEAYQRLLDIAAQAGADEGVRQGLEDAKAGRIRPARVLHRIQSKV
jgi:hypothetical protein